MTLVSLTFSKTALDNLGTIPHKARVRLIKKAKALIDDPHPRGSKKLWNYAAGNHESVYRLRSGDHRILYLVRSHPGEVVVFDIGHRKDVYRNR